MRSPLPRPPHHDPGPLALLALMLPVWVFGSSSCAGPGQERHFAPLYSELSIAGGDHEIEALAGSFLLRRDGQTGQIKYWALRPFLSDEVVSDTRRSGQILPPLGIYRRKPEEDVFQFLPLLRFARQYPVGAPSTWSLLAMPGIYWAKTNDGRVVRAWFPFGGVVEGFLSFDRAVFAAFPLYSRTERNGRISRNFLWPIFRYTNGTGGPSWRVWPLFGVNRFEGRYERWFFLWPIFNWQRNDQLLAHDEYSWLVWPLFGRRKQGAATSWTALWPLFGYSHNSENGFWAWDGPWPLVVFQEPGSSGQAARERVWPFYSRFDGDGLHSRYILWPFYNVRREEYARMTKDTSYFFPFWHAWDKRDRHEGTSHWRKLFPVYRSFHAEKGDEHMVAFPALSPFWRLKFIDEHYAWMWELYNERRVEDRLRERSWLGLWRREKDRDEDRRSLSMIWARRDYSMNGEPVSETSILLGLIRWRSSAASSGFLRPAFPGPGWPMERLPSSLPTEQQP
jgi:hypothetical protein